MAANRVGKTESIGGYELVLHMTGRYPDWWKGRRFEDPVKAWAAGDTNETVRDIIQAKLLGKWEEKGTGLIPGDDLIKITPRPGLPEMALDIYVKHISGGTSVVTLKSYEQGRKKFQGTEIDIVWLDEEPPLKIYSECLVRTMTTKGLVMLTFTPLSGMSEVVLSFMSKVLAKTKRLIQAGWDDVPHLSQDDKDELTEGLPSHEIEARSKGIPSLGSGAIFPVDEKHIKIDPIEIPTHWPQIAGIDFGWDHPTAAARLAWDRDNDIVYLINGYRKSETTPAEHATVLRKWGAWLPWSWPHDGYQHDKGSGKALADQYRDEDMEMLDEHATHEKGGNGVEAGLMDMLTRMREGRFKVFSTVPDFFDEMRLYHRDEGKVVKVRDDLICATRYGIMMLREAITDPGDTHSKPLNYSNNGIY